MKPNLRLFCLLAFASILSASICTGRSLELNPATGMPKDVGIAPKIGAQVPLDLVFRDEAGNDVPLSKYVNQQPVILSLVYYDCPMLCNLVLNGLLRSMRALSIEAGKDFQVLTVSFDPKETPELAASKRANYLREYNRAGGEQGWHFLTGDALAITTLTQTVGFSYAYDEDAKQFAHGAAIIVLTPGGKVSRYFYGVEYPVRDLRLAMVESSHGRLGTVTDQVLLLCYQYDLATGRYGATIMTAVRLASLATVLAIASLVTILVILDHRKRKRAEVEALV